MSLEAKIEALTVAVTKLIAAIEGTGTTSVAQPIAAVQTVTQPSAPPVEPQMPVVVQNVAANVSLSPAMPPAPAIPQMVAMPAELVTPAPIKVPFTDGQGMIAWVMAKYQALGPQKGASIQNVLTSMGVLNINDVKPEQYEQFYVEVEKL